MDLDDLHLALDRWSRTEGERRVVRRNRLGSWTPMELKVAPVAGPLRF